MEKEIIEAIRIALEKSIKGKEISKLLEVPPNPSMGDYAFPCYTLTRETSISPKDLASDLAQKLSHHLAFEKVEAKGPYVNFFINRSEMAEKIIKQINKEKDSYGSTNLGKNKSVLIEHTSINPNASPHMGRARNALIGDSIVRILKFQKYKPEVHYFVNDVGKQIAMVVLGAERKRGVKFKDLLELYVEINKEAAFKKGTEEKVLKLLNKLESGNASVIKKFKKVVATCIEGQTKILNKLDIHYDFYDYESDYLWNKKAEKALDALKRKKKTFVDYAKRVVLNQEGYKLPLKSPVLVLTRSDKTSLYPLRDIAYTLDKMKKNKNNLIVLGEDQKTYFKQIEAALDILGKESPKAIHYSFLLLKEGKMSTRKGNVVLLEHLISELMSKARNNLKSKSKIKNSEIERRAKAITNASIKYSILKVDPLKNVIFDMDKALSFEGDTGPYLLYTYARANSILKKVKPSKTTKLPSVKITDVEKNLINKLKSFPEMVLKSTERYAPNLIANYAYDLAQSFNEFYQSDKVIGSESEKFKIALISAFNQVLKNALSLIGIKVLEEM